MESLPADVWFHILPYACTDGGRTGVSLSSASRHLRAVSASFRFYSLKLGRLAQIGQLLLCHERLQRSLPSATHHPFYTGTDPHTLGTRHLLLTFLPEDCDAPPRAWREWSEYSRRKDRRREQVEEDERAWAASKAAWDRQFVFLVPQLFALVAPRLETLAVLQCAAIPLPYVGGAFPALRELSLLADDRIFVRPDVLWWRQTEHAAPSAPEEHRAAGGGSSAASFPALTHLHIVYDGLKEVAWEKTIPVWGRLAPSVTHLRISQASNLIPEVLREIATASPSHLPGSSKGRRVSFPNLQRAIVQPFVLEPISRYDPLEKVGASRQDPRRRGGPTIVMMRGRWYRGDYWKDRLRWEWEGRMFGESECWAEREQDEGEWAYERKKRAEVADLKAKRLAAGAPATERIVPTIHLNNGHDHPLRTLAGRRVWRSWTGGFLRERLAPT